MNEAIGKAFARHEILGCRIIQSNDGTAYYSPLPDAVPRIQIRKLDDIDTDWIKLIHEQERVPFDWENGELIRFFVLQGENVTQLVIVAHHLAGDGMSVLYLVKDIMTALGNPGIGMEKLQVRNLRDDDIPKKAGLNPLLKLMISMTNVRWRKIKRVFKYSNYRGMFTSFWDKKDTEILKGCISGDELNALIDKCKQNNVTVNSAITTAFIKASGERSDVGLAASIRPQGFEGMANFATGISIQYTYDDSRSFWENVSYVHELIYRKLENPSKKYFILNFMASLDPTLVDAAYLSAEGCLDNNLARKAADMFGYTGNPKSISITNLTRTDIPQSFGNYTLSDLFFVARLFPMPGALSAF